MNISNNYFSNEFQNYCLNVSTTLPSDFDYKQDRSDLAPDNKPIEVKNNQELDSENRLPSIDILLPADSFSPISVIRDTATPNPITLDQQEAIVEILRGPSKAKARFCSNKNIDKIEKSHKFTNLMKSKQLDVPLDTQPVHIPLEIQPVLVPVEIQRRPFHNLESIDFNDSLLQFEALSLNPVIQNIRISLSKHFIYKEKINKPEISKMNSSAYQTTVMHNFDRQKTMLGKIEYLLRRRCFDIHIQLADAYKNCDHQLEINLLKVDSNQQLFAAKTDEFKNIRTRGLSDRIIEHSMLFEGKGKSIKSGDLRLHKIQVVFKLNQKNRTDTYVIQSNTFKLSSSQTLGQKLKELEKTHT